MIGIAVKEISFEVWEHLESFKGSAIASSVSQKRIFDLV